MRYRENQESSRVEREKDLVWRLMAQLARGALNPADLENAHFMQWYARQARMGARESTAAEQERFVERLRSRRMVVSSRVHEVAGLPESSRCDVDGTLAEIIGAASRAHRVPTYDLSVAAGVGRVLWEEPCERWVALPDGVEDGRYVALTVAGDSMEPLLASRDMILVRLGSELAPGSVVVARHPDDGYLVKRVGRVGDREVELESLNDAYAPVSIPHDESLVLGTVVLRWRSLGTRGRVEKRGQIDSR